MVFTSDMLIRDALLAHPDAAGVFEEYGLHCASCLAADIESVSAGTAAHGSSLQDLLDALNALTGSDGRDSSD